MYISHNFLEKILNLILLLFVLDEKYYLSMKLLNEQIIGSFSLMFDTYYNFFFFDFRRDTGGISFKSIWVLKKGFPVVLKAPIFDII